MSTGQAFGIASGDLEPTPSRGITCMIFSHQSASYNEFDLFQGMTQTVHGSQDGDYIASLAGD